MSLKPVGVLVVLVACGHKPAPITNPDFSPIATKSSARGTLYADCLAEAIANQRYGHAQDGSTHVLQFTCTAAPARAFFEGLGGWANTQRSEAKADGKVFRSTNRVRKNLFGVDYCASDGALYECVITLNVGEFVAVPATK